MKNVLLIDGDIYNQENIRLNLISSNNHIDCVNTAKEGLEYLNNKDYDLIISEVLLPDQNGVTLARKIKEMGRKSKFILLTDVMEKDLQDTARELHIDKLVQKPYDEPELFYSIREMLADD
jgi:CheY-like chemotaxis protein